MGRPKALLPYGTGSFLTTILDRIRPLGLPYLAVVTSPELAGELTGFQTIVNPEPEAGQLSSLQLGLRAAGEGCPWVLVALVDHPAVSATTYRALAAAAEAGGAHLWVPRYDGRRGHPLVYGSPCYADIRAAPLDQGARWVVARHRSERREVPVEDPEILRDVDTPEAYEALLRET